MAYVELTPYLRGQRPALAGSDRDHIDRELQKIEAAIRALSAAVVELREKKRDV